VLLAKRLNYRTLIYAEDVVRWPQFASRYLLRSPELLAIVSPRYLDRCAVVGDLFVDAVATSGETSSPGVARFVAHDASRLLLGLLPGSKPAKLALGVPFFLAVAEEVALR
jgi:hypothetical protein